MGSTGNIAAVAVRGSPCCKAISRWLPAQAEQSVSCAIESGRDYRE